MSNIEKNTPIGAIAQNNALLSDLRSIVEQARCHVAATVNYDLTMMYWHMGERINREVLGNERAEYGKQIVSTVSSQLQREFGAKGFDERNIRRMMQFAQLMPGIQIVATLSRQLSWSHFVEVMPLKDKLSASFISQCHLRIDGAFASSARRLTPCFMSALLKFDGFFLSLGKSQNTMR